MFVSVGCSGCYTSRLLQKIICKLCWHFISWMFLSAWAKWRKCFRVSLSNISHDFVLFLKQFTEYIFVILVHYCFYLACHVCCGVNKDLRVHRNSISGYVVACFFIFLFTYFLTLDKKIKHYFKLGTHWCDSLGWYYYPTLILLLWVITDIYWYFWQWTNKHTTLTLLFCFSYTLPLLHHCHML